MVKLICITQFPAFICWFSWDLWKPHQNLPLSVRLDCQQLSDSKSYQSRRWMTDNPRYKRRDSSNGKAQVSQEMRMKRRWQWDHLGALLAAGTENVAAKHGKAVLQSWFLTLFLKTWCDQVEKEVPLNVVALCLFLHTSIRIFSRNATAVPGRHWYLNVTSTNEQRLFEYATLFC